MRGLFVTFEGPDGSGKTTLSKAFYEYLDKKYDNVVLTREPGGTNVAISESIRSLLLDNKGGNMDPKTEALLFAASRAQHVAEFIKPALDKGKIVICDRYIHSSIAYQGYARDIGIEGVYEINKFATNDVIPDMTFYIDIDYQVGLDRIKNSGREMDRLDKETNEMHKKVSTGYKKALSLIDNNYFILDGNESKEKLLEQVILNFNQHLFNKK